MVARLCAALDCKPGDLLDYLYEPSDQAIGPDEDI
ncbi:helix-turn-helix domain-containing protein [Brevundimonas vesicularis]|nr:helix-turn-helix domain-containing protein [Brevundimonas vesicularis]